MEIRNDKKFKDRELRTLKQWERLKKIPIDINSGIEMWTNGCHQYTARYYDIEEVRDMDEQEKNILCEKLRPIRERKNELRRMRYARKNYKKNIEKANTLPFVQCENKSGSIVIDTETTGPYSSEDEILQLSIIDGNGNILLNTYVKPLYHNEWKDAEKINHITKEMVKSAPTIFDLIPILNGIFNSATELILYNADFDLDFIKYHTGIDVKKNQKVTDVMIDFANYFKDWDDKHKCCRWQKLTFASNYFGFKWDIEAHNSLADIKATLFVKNKLSEVGEFEQYELYSIENDKETVMCKSRDIGHIVSLAESTIHTVKVYAKYSNENKREIYKYRGREQIEWNEPTCVREYEYEDYYNENYNEE